MAVEAGGGGGSGGGGGGVPQWDGNGMMSPEQIAQVAYNAGFRGQDLTNAVAIALAESSGDPGVNSHYPGEDSRGLWQINEVHFGRYDREALYDPEYNARAAFEIFQSSGFQPWSTFAGTTEGGRQNSHTKHLDTAARAVQAVTGEQQVVAASARRDGGGGVQTAPAPAGGGGGGAGAGGFGPTTSFASGFDSPQEADEAAARSLAYEIYGGMAEYFLNHPELGPIIAQAGKEGWDAGRLRGAVSQTDWWGATSQSQRAWETLNATDPGEAKARLKDRTEDLLDEAERLGIQLTNGRARQLAEMSLKVNWDGQDISRAIGQEGLRRDAPDRDSGQIGALTNKIRGLASDYMVPVSDEWAYESAVKIATGQMAEVEAENFMRGMAKSRFGHLEDVYDRGLTTRQYMEPYIQRYSQLMEVNPNDVDVMENKHLSRIVDHRDKDGERRSMTLAESEDYLRSTDEWHKTDNARGQFADMAKGLMSFFGKAS